MDTSNVARAADTNISHPTENDVLCGRGKFTLRWKGNTYFRSLAEHHKAEYLTGDNFKKKRIAQTIVDTIHALHPPGRFLKCDADKNIWYDIGNHAALRKTRQALREGSTTSKDTSSAGKETMYDSDSLKQSSIESCSDNDDRNMLEKSNLNKKENYSAYPSEIEEKIESDQIENDSFTMDETDSWAFLGESANLSDFNPKEVFSADDAIEGLQLSTDEENCINSRNDETMVENFFSHASHSSFKKS